MTARRLPRYAEAIRKRRTELKLSQARLAAAAGCSQTTISNMENGLKDPLELDLAELHKLIGGLHWTPTDFVVQTGLELPLAGNVEKSLEALALRDIHTLASMETLTLPAGFVPEAYDPAEMFAARIDPRTLAPEDVRYQLQQGTVMVHQGLAVEDGRLVLGHTTDGVAVIYRHWVDESRITVQDYGARRPPFMVDTQRLKTAGVIVGNISLFTF